MFTFKVGQFKKNCTTHLTLILKIVSGGWLFSFLFIYVGGKNHLVATLWLVTHLWPCQSLRRVFLRPGAHRRLETGVPSVRILPVVVCSLIQHKHILIHILSRINYLSDFHSFSVESTERRITTHSSAHSSVCINSSWLSEWFLEH